MPPRILLLGGIGSGKSRVAAMFADHGAVTISADDIAREVLAPGSDAAAAVLAMWPEAGEEGVIDRQSLGRIVFADPAELAALETITHPATRYLISEEVAAHPDEVVVVEMPLLRDWFTGHWIVVVVDAPIEIRIERALGRHQGMYDREHIERIIARQPTRSALLESADYVIDNSGSIDALAEQCESLWKRLVGS